MVPLAPTPGEHPSFKVNTALNLWYDYGLGRGGDIILLGRILYAIDHVPTILRRIADTAMPTPGASVEAHPKRQAPSAEEIRDVEVRPLTHRPLLSYLSTRGVDLTIATLHCAEIHYTRHGRPYYGLAFANDAGGYEVRNAYFKGCHLAKDITHIPCADARHCCLFEGFMDFLSYLTLRRRQRPGFVTPEFTAYLVLNSVANLRKAIPVLAQYEVIHSYLDNDEAGRHATQELRETFQHRVIDETAMYQGYKDVNDFLRGKRMME